MTNVMYLLEQRNYLENIVENGHWQLLAKETAKFGQYLEEIQHLIDQPIYDQFKVDYYNYDRLVRIFNGGDHYDKQNVN